MNEFEKLNVSSYIIEALDRENILVPTPIQEKTIPILLEGKDVIGGAQTGTGKTFAYSIPLIENVYDMKHKVSALVLCPTRELSIQVKTEMDKLLKNTHLTCEAIYGGESYVIQNKKLRNRPEIIIGTPGRIIDQMNKGNLSFKDVKNLVLDEADEMLKMGFQDDLETILKEVPEERQTALFSATLPDFIKKLAKKYMKEPEMIQIEAKTLTVDAINQEVYYCKKDSKRDLVIRLLDYNEFKHVMIFSNTKSMVDELIIFLQNQGFMADGLHGDLKQAQRDRVMSQFRSGAISILIATDVAARGIDIDDIDCVINFDIPQENEIYVHRIGRTGRAGRSGTAITLSTTRGKERIRDLERYTHSKINVCEIPSIDKIKENYLKKLYLEIKESIDNNGDITQFDKMIRSFAKESTDPLPLIRGLIALIANNEERVYNEIEVIKEKPKKESRRDSKDKNSNSKNKDRKNDKSKNDKSKSNFKVLEINIGEVDNVKPNQLVNLFHDDLKVHREHFGKIVINKTRTFFEIKEEALRFFNSRSKVKFNNKTITFRLVDKNLR